MVSVSWITPMTLVLNQKHLRSNLSDWERYIEHCKSSIRSKVEHVFRIIKCQFGYKKRLSRIKEKRKSLDS